MLSKRPACSDEGFLFTKALFTPRSLTVKRDFERAFQLAAAQTGKGPTHSLGSFRACLEIPSWEGERPREPKYLGKGTAIRARGDSRPPEDPFFKHALSPGNNPGYGLSACFVVHLRYLANIGCGRTGVVLMAGAPTGRWRRRRGWCGCGARESCRGLRPGRGGPCPGSRGSGCATSRPS